MTGTLSIEQFKEHIDKRLCRVCLKENGTKNIFENKENLLVSYAFMITFCTSIDVTDYERLPKKLCKKCSETLIDLYEFKKNFLKSENKLQELLQKHLDNKVTHLSRTGTEMILIKEEIGDEGEFLEENVNNDNINKMERYDSLWEEKSYQCEACGLVIYASKRKNHVCKHNPKREPFTCQFCNKNFIRLDCLKRHLRIHTGERPFECNICKKKFVQKTTLDTHKKIHTGEKCYVCEFCGKTFSQTGTLTYHRRLHTGETPYKCEVCHKGFVHSGNLNKHMSFHSRERRHYSCEICDKKFFTESHLSQHTKVHKNDKAYKCAVCGKGFVRNDYLKNHLVTHTNEKPYSCGVCSKTFSQSGHRSRHMKMHKV